MLTAIARELILCDRPDAESTSLFDDRDRSVSRARALNSLTDAQPHLLECLDADILSSEDIKLHDNLKEYIFSFISADSEEAWQHFEAFHKAWPAKEKKRGIDTEWRELKKHRDYRQVAPRLLPAIESEKAWREQRRSGGLFLPTMKNMKTWLHNRCWETEYKLEENERTGKDREPDPQPNYDADFS